MSRSLTQLMLLSIAYAVGIQVARYCDRTSAKRKQAERYILTWEGEGGSPASTAVSYCN
jgi:hypothetical protein